MSRESEPILPWLLCYDIHQPRRRRRVAARLEGHGQRVQRSVFITECSPHRAKRLEEQCRTQIAPTDSLRLYLLMQRVPEALPWLLAGRGSLPGYWLC